MHAIELAGPNLASFISVTKPEPAQPDERQVLVRMRAASLNFIDLAVARGTYPGVHYPIVPVADGAGEVVAVGSAVTHLKSGDRVAVHPKAIWTGGSPTRERAKVMRGVTMAGSLSEYQLVDAGTLVKAPAHLSWGEIAALPITFTTAWNGVVEGSITAGATVVVLGTGGASLAALQLAHAQGARVIVTSSSDDKLDRARSLGAEEGINYRVVPDWDQRVLELTEGAGADLLFEAAGAATFGRSLNAVRHGGTVFTIGFNTGAATEIDLMAVIVKALRVVGANTGSADDLGAAMRVIGSAGLHPVIAAEYGVRDVAAAYAAFAESDRFGKIVLNFDW